MVRFKGLLLIAMGFFVVLVATSPAFAAGPSWTSWARKVGQGETEALRTYALSRLKKEKNLQGKLVRALDTSDRLLALDVISSLGMTDLVPELVTRVERDSDGFLTLNLNTLINEKNKSLILDAYVGLLRPKKNASVSAGAIVAMLEPLGRLGHTLSKPTITSLMAHTFPEVRSATLYFLRAMSLIHRKHENAEQIPKFLAAEEFQLRLQAVAVLSELADAPGAPMSRENLIAKCKRESHLRVKTQCQWLAEKKQVVP